MGRWTNKPPSVNTLNPVTCGGLKPLTEVKIVAALKDRTYRVTPTRLGVVYPDASD